MTTGKKYIQVFIKTEVDLPKEEGSYWCQTKNYLWVTKEKFDKSPTGILFWETLVDWYLLPEPEEITDDYNKAIQEIGRLQKELDEANKYIKALEEREF